MRNKVVCFCNLVLGLLYIFTTVLGYSAAFSMKEYIHLADLCAFSLLIYGAKMVPNFTKSIYVAI